MGLGKENDLLLALLKAALTGEEGAHWEVFCGENAAAGDGTEFRQWLQIAGAHSVLPLLYPVCVEQEKEYPGDIQEAVEKAAISASKQSYRLLFLSKFLVNQLKEADVPVVILKGVATAQFYPVPEYRKSGDVDLLLTEPDKLDLCCEVLEACGLVRKNEQHALHHISFAAEGGIDVELHTLLAEPFDNRKINQYLENLVGKCSSQVRQTEIMGIILPVLQDGFHAFELLLHMLQHFLRSGFGLKLLCDWVVFWNRECANAECETYLKLVRESGLKGFSDMVTLVCCRYLGLGKDRVAWMELGSDYDTAEFMREILEAEEFGRSSADRMVVMRGSGLWDYFREFHHQMRLNFPKAGKCFLCWPVLWMITLVNFVKNNRKVRNVSTKAVFDKAAQRSKIIQQMKLWKS